MRQIAFIMALFVSGLFAANLDISDSIAPSQDNANPSANQSANPQPNSANQANPNANNANQSANPNANQNANAVNPNTNPTTNPPANQNANPTANNANPNPPQSTQAQTPKAQKEQKPRPSDPDERLKEDIVSFEREKHIQNGANIDDPFIYVYQQTEDEVARRAQLEQALLTLKLKSIIVVPDSNNNRIKRYKAHINNQWVEECKKVGGKKQCDSIEGWEVAQITGDSVKLRFTRYNMKHDLQLMSKKVTITKEDYK